MATVAKSGADAGDVLSGGGFGVCLVDVLSRFGGGDGGGCDGGGFGLLRRLWPMLVK